MYSTDSQHCCFHLPPKKNSIPNIAVRPKAQSKPSKPSRPHPIPYSYTTLSLLFPYHPPPHPCLIIVLSRSRNSSPLLLSHSSLGLHINRRTLKVESTLEELQCENCRAASPQHPVEGCEYSVGAGCGAYGAAAEEKFAEEDGECNEAGKVE
jgi:hypothetical protein